MSSAALPLTDSRKAWGYVLVALAAWIAAYLSMGTVADAVVSLLPWRRGTSLGEAIHFFVFDTAKVLLLLTLIVFVVGVVQTFFSPARTRALLTGRHEGAGNAMAATLGIVTPFCSCSAVPLFMGFLTAGIPLGVTLSFLISAPMVNEIALGLLFALFGWKIAALYLGMGLAVAILAGWVIGRMGLEHLLEDWVRDLIRSGLAESPDTQAAPAWRDRLEAGRQHVLGIVGKVWPFVLAGIAVGAAIHGYVPQDFMASIMGREVWWAVPLAVLIGVPMYSNAAGIIPVVEALLAKGAALGTVLAFMMSVIALSAPEMIILRKVLKPGLIAIFAGIVAAGILAVGYVFNWIL